MPSLTAGEQEWDYLYADDAADGLICMAENGKDGAIYPLGTGKVKTLREYFEMIRDAIDPKLRLGLGEIPYAPNQVMHLQADISSLQNDTGFVAKTDFADGIKKTVEARRAK